MRHTSLTILVFIAGLGIGFFARSAYKNITQRRTHAADLVAIEKLQRTSQTEALRNRPRVNRRLVPVRCAVFGVKER